jgi:predicted transcriptional regulator
MQTTTIIGQVYNVLLQERVKTAIIAYKTLSKNETLTWHEIYVKSGIKEELGVSQKTLASVLKSWIEEGILKKEKAPFPWRTKYRLISSSSDFERILSLTQSTSDRCAKTEKRLVGRKLSRPSRSESITVANEVIEELLGVCRETFWKLLSLDFEGGRQPDPYKVSLACFTLLDYFLHSAANLHGEARAYLEKSLWDELTRDMQIEMEKKPSDDTFEKILKKA